MKYEYSNKKFKHVSYLWDDAKAAALAGDEVALIDLSFQFIGRRSAADQLWWWQYFLQSNGKRSSYRKRSRSDVGKRHGGDLGTMKRNGLAALYVDRLRQFKKCLSWH